MKALRFHQYGGPDVLKFDEDAPMPVAGPGQVVVKVSGAGVNPVDWKLREGHLAGFFPVQFPVTSNWEFSGTVHELGDGVTEYAIGDAIYGISHFGTCAEYTLANVAETGRAPAVMDLADAGGVPLAGLTAWQALFNFGGVEAGQRVLIHAAAGGVGTFAVQFAKWKGAYVIATASDANRHLVEELGADEIINYRETPFETVVSNVDMVLESIGGEQMLKSLSVVKPGGIIVSISTPEPAEEAATQGKRAAYLFMQATTADLDQISALITDLKLRPIISTVVPYHEAVEVQKESQTGRTVGKLVVRVS